MVSAPRGACPAAVIALDGICDRFARDRADRISCEAAGYAVQRLRRLSADGGTGQPAVYNAGQQLLGLLLLDRRGILRAGVLDDVLARLRSASFRGSLGREL